MCWVVVGGDNVVAEVTCGEIVDVVVAEIAYDVVAVDYTVVVGVVDNVAGANVCVYYVVVVVVEAYKIVIVVVVYDKIVSARDNSSVAVTCHCIHMSERSYYEKYSRELRF